MNESFDLSTTECEELLRAGLVGRVAACTPNGPHIIPVNYSVVDDAIVLRTTPYSLLGSQARGTVLALEVDQFDYEYHRGWSVVARGRGDVVVDPDELEHIRETWNPAAWAAGGTVALPAPALDRAHRAPARSGLGPDVDPAARSTDRPP